MSASASKKKRKELLLTPSTEAKKESKLGKKIAIGIVAAVVAIALVISIGMLVKSNDYKVSYDVTKPAMTVGDYEVSVPMFNYFYTGVLNNYLNYGYLNYGLIQQGVALSQQTYMGSLGSEDSPTWEAELIDEAKTQITNTVNLYLEAQKAGYTLSDEDNKAIEESVKSLKDSAKENGYNFFGLTTDWFVADYFGNGCTMENYKDFVTLTQVCSGYMAAKEAEFEPTADEISKEYADNADDYDVVSYSLYTVNAQADGKDENDADTYSDDAIAAAKADADKAAESFPAEGTTSATRGFASVSQSVTEDAAKWLFDTARKAGDTAAFASAEGRTNYVVRFDARDDNKYNAVNAYVLSFSYDAEDAEVEAGKLTAKEKFEKFSNAGTNLSEEDFTKLAEDCGFSASSRLVDRHALNAQLTDFLYDGARADGDIFSLADDESSTYYVVRFVSAEEETYQTQLVESSLHKAAESAWLDEVYAANEAVTDDAALANAYTDRVYG